MQTPARLTPVRPTPAQPAPKVAALVTEIMEEARKNAAQPTAAPPSPIPRYLSATIVIALCAWVWLAPPEWLVPRPAAPPSQEYREASARVALALHAQRVESYRVERGRLPRTKIDVGIASDQITYSRGDDGTYELSTRVDGQLVRYRSTQPREQYLTAAMHALNRARR